jgi:hypothetical protein
MGLCYYTPAPATVHLDPPRRGHELRYRVCTECDRRVEHEENG